MGHFPYKTNQPLEYANVEDAWIQVFVKYFKQFIFCHWFVGRIEGNQYKFSWDFEILFSLKTTHSILASHMYGEPKHFFSVYVIGNDQINSAVSNSTLNFYCYNWKISNESYSFLLLLGQICNSMKLQCIDKWKKSNKYSSWNQTYHST